MTRIDAPRVWFYDAEFWGGFGKLLLREWRLLTLLYLYLFYVDNPPLSLLGLALNSRMKGWVGVFEKVS